MKRKLIWNRLLVIPIAKAVNEPVSGLMNDNIVGETGIEHPAIGFGKVPKQNALLGPAVERVEIRYRVWSNLELV
jgi:hypothetical protein